MNSCSTVHVPIFDLFTVFHVNLCEKFCELMRIPVIFILFQCHVSIIPIYSCMENRCLKEFSKTVAVAMFLCVLNYTGTAAFGYLTFGNMITTDILLSYDPDEWVIVAVLLIAIKTYTTYPILLFCGRYVGYNYHINSCNCVC